MSRRSIFACLLICGFSHLSNAEDTPETRALRFLEAEVPRWSVEHKCFSCHNNGDAARALYQAIQIGRDVSATATIDTDRWLSRPEGWEKNGGDGRFSDKTLARVQFASALTAGVKSNRIKDRKPLDLAARRLAEDQSEDGSWRVDEQGRVGSPVTYGRPLATWLAVEALQSADPVLYRPRIDRGRAWLRLLKPVNTPDVSTFLLAWNGDAKGSGESVKSALEWLGKAQASEGGWGPFARSAPEAFDTALAMLALDRYRDEPGVARLIERGRAYLISTQQEDGSWAETTRPSGGESYAQRISTTGWATLALITVKHR